MKDSIHLKNIRAFGKHGANPGEKDNEQPFDIDVEMIVNLNKASISDALADTVDYGNIYRQIVQTVKTNSFSLLERLGDQILEEILTDSRIEKATLSIAKPGIFNGCSPSIVMKRSNSKT